MLADKKFVEVVAAAIIDGDSVYCFRKGTVKYPYLSHKFEFPGGKIEDSEAIESALVREIREELQVEILVHSKIATVEHEYPDFWLRMTCFACTSLSPKFQLQEHSEVRLINKRNLLELEWLAADLPIVKKIMEDRKCLT